MSDPLNVKTPVSSTKGILAISIVFVYIGIWAYAVYTALGTPMSPTFDPTDFLLNFAGATGVMEMIVLLVVQNFFRKTEAQ